MWKVIPWVREGEPHFCLHESRACTGQQWFRGVLLHAALFRPQGLNAHVFGVCGVQGWIPFPKDINSLHHPVLEAKMQQAGAIRDSPQRRAPIWIKMLIERHSPSIFGWATSQHYIPFVSLSFLSSPHFPADDWKELPFGVGLVTRPQPTCPAENAPTAANPEPARGMRDTPF